MDGLSFKISMPSMTEQLTNGYIKTVRLAKQLNVLPIHPTLGVDISKLPQDVVDYLAISKGFWPHMKSSINIQAPAAVSATTGASVYPINAQGEHLRERQIVPSDPTKVQIIADARNIMPRNSSKLNSLTAHQVPKIVSRAEMEGRSIISRHGPGLLPQVLTSPGVSGSLYENNLRPPIPSSSVYVTI